ncbi:importin-13 isoform X2 [Strongylocentrotus purpuratus]|uniref:Importin-13 n=1 Tax=Strongylocentrotus purpuratus TaxID=7668 RepID=A0A7M7PMX9_STRPU|nr:importin-13 isoform X2 [Strongylocentrotus purpuratus]
MRMASALQASGESQPEVTLDNIEKAIHELYYDPSADVKDSAQRWLLMAQRSPQAWQFAWALLDHNKAPEVQYFGASVLHSKISRSWPEVPSEQYEMLRTQLFQQIFNSALGTRIVLTRLCVALSSFALSTMPDVWPDAVKSIIETFQQAHTPHLDAMHRCAALLELLTVLPEEFQTAPMSQHRKSTVRHELEKGMVHVLPLLQSLLEQDDSPTHIRHQALRCFSSWVQLSVPLTEIESFQKLLFQLIHDPDLFDYCVDSLVNVVSQPTAHKYPSIVRSIIREVLKLQEMLASSVREKNMDTVQGLCRLAVTLGENHTKLLVESTGEDKQHAMEFTSLVLGFTALPGHYPVDETISNMPFGFWYLLQDDIVSADTDKLESYVQTYAPVFLQLVEVMLRKVQYPDDEEYDGWTEDEKEQFRCYRQDIGDTLMYCHTLLKDPLLNHLYASLTRIQDQDSSWQHVEACLFAFRSIAEGGDYGDDQCAANLLQLIGQINMSHVKLASTALYMLGAYSEWLTDMPEALGSIIPVLLSGLNDAELAAPATMSLKDIASDCIPGMRAHAEVILTASQQALMANVLKSREATRLMSVIGLVLSSLPQADIMNYLEVILTPHVQALEEVANQQPSPSGKSTILVKLTMMANLCASLDIKREDKSIIGKGEIESKSSAGTQDTQPVLLILQKILPIVEKLLNMWISDAAIVESVCELLKRAMRTLLDDLQPLVPQLCDLLCRMYNTVPQPTMLDLAQQIIILFGSVVSLNSAIASLFLQLSSKTLSLLPNNAREHTDVLEEYMTTCAQLLKKHTKIFTLDELNLAAIFQCGLVSMTMPENHTIKACCLFFGNFVSQSDNLPGAGEVLTQHGKPLVELTLKAITGGAPRNVVDNLSDILFSLNKHAFTKFSGWITDIMLNTTVELPRATKEQREHFGSTILRNRANKRQVRSLVKEFSLICRGLHGTDYAEY